MDRKRFDEIDVIRAFGIIGVIIVHILTYNLSFPIYKFLWNNLQFVVISFVFCSGFVLSSIYQNYFTNFSKTVFWYKKRFIRLILPFWIYLIVHYSLWILFPSFFSGLGLVKNADYFVRSALFIGGTNFNWLPLLFLQLTFLFPIFSNWINKKKIMATYILGSSVVTAIFTMFLFPYSQYRLVMWIPWSIVLIFSMYIANKAKSDKNEKQTNTRYLISGVFFFVIFLILYLLNLDLGKVLNFYNHKYPPDFYYLFFGLSLTCFSLLIARLKIWQNKIIKSVYFYISNNSYQIFFIHYIILDSILVMSKTNNIFKSPVIDFVIILSLSLFINEGINRLGLVFKKK